MRNSVLVLMTAVVSSACGYVSVYHIEPVKAAWSGWTTLQNNRVSEVINVADPTQPVKVGEFRRAAANIDVQDTLAYLSGGGLYVYNVTDPTDPLVVDSLTTGFPYAFSIAVADTLAYLGCRDAVRLVSIADPHNMRVVASAPVPQSAWKMTYVAPHLYAACFDGGVCIFDTASPGISEVPSANLRAGDVLLASSPVRDHAIVRIRNAARKEVMSSAYTAAGVRVPVVAAVSVGDRWTTLRFDLRSVASGVYLLRIRMGETAHSLRVVKL